MAPPDDPDEPWIAIAMLHGAEIWQTAAGRWMVGDPMVWHPVELERKRNGKSGSFSSAGELARAYCEYHGIKP